MTARAKELLGLALLLAIAAALALSTTHASETGLRLLAAGRARDFTSEAPLFSLALSLAGPRVGAAFEVGALLLSYRVLRALRISPWWALVALIPIAFDRSIAAEMTSGGPASPALLGFALLVAVHVVRSGVLGRVGASPLATALVCASSTLLSFDLVVVALAVVIARHPTRRSALLVFVGATVAIRLALGGLVPAPIATEAALIARMPALWAVTPHGLYLASLSENVDRFLATAAAFPLAIFAGFFVVGIFGRGRGRVCARTLRLAAPVGGALLSCVLFAWFVAPSASRMLPLVTGGLFCVVGALDRMRAPSGPVLAGVLALASAATARAPIVVHRTLEPSGRVLCAPCGDAWLARRDVISLDSLDEAGRGAIREGTLLAYLRARGVVTLAIDPVLVNEALLGPRAREELVPEGGVFRLAKVPDEALLLTGAVLAADPAFAPHVGDGFVLGPTGASSRAPRGELTFVAPAGINRSARLQLLLRAAVDATQPIDVTIDGASAGRVVATVAPQWFDVPLVAAKIGRSRVRLVFPNARRLENKSPDAWRSPTGRSVAAVVVEGMRIVTGDEPTLPPHGPGLADVRADRLLRSGFMPVERAANPAGVWSTGPSTIAFFLTPARGRHRLELEAGPPPDGDQDVTVTLNGKRLGELHFPPASIETRTLDVPEAALVDGDNVLTLSFARIQEGRALYLRRVALGELP